MTPRFPQPCRAAALAVACLGLAGPAAAQPASAPAADEPVPTFDAGFLGNPDNIRAGEGVWQTQCRHCHGNAAYPGKAPKLKPGLLEPGFIFDRVTYGFRGMPPWRTVFTREQRMAVVAYIKSDSFAP
jgi:mono/diheme cytochrome c family protein